MLFPSQCGGWWETGRHTHTHIRTTHKGTYKYTGKPKRRRHTNTERHNTELYNVHTDSHTHTQRHIEVNKHKRHRHTKTQRHTTHRAIESPDSHSQRHIQAHRQTQETQTHTETQHTELYNVHRFTHTHSVWVTACKEDHVLNLCVTAGLNPSVFVSERLVGLAASPAFALRRACSPPPSAAYRRQVSFPQAAEVTQKKAARPEGGGQEARGSAAWAGVPQPVRCPQPPRAQPRTGNGPGRGCPGRWGWGQQEARARSRHLARGGPRQGHGARACARPAARKGARGREGVWSRVPF